MKASVRMTVPRVFAREPSLKGCERLAAPSQKQPKFATADIARQLANVVLGRVSADRSCDAFFERALSPEAKHFFDRRLVQHRERRVLVAGHEGLDLPHLRACTVRNPSQCRSEAVLLDPFDVGPHRLVQHAALAGQVDLADVSSPYVLGFLDGDLLLQFPDLLLHHRAICGSPGNVCFLVLGDE